MAGLTTLQMVLLGGAAVLALGYLGVNAPAAVGKVKEFFTSVKNGDIVPALEKLFANSKLTQKVQTVKGDAGNLLCYAKVRLNSDEILAAVDPAKKPEVEAALLTIKLALAAAPSVPPTAT